MALKLANNGATDILEKYIANAGTLQLKLFINDITPTATMTAADFTEAPTQSPVNYVKKSLAASSWIVSTVANVVQAAYSTAQTFQFVSTLTGTATVYGYYITTAAGVLIFSEKFAEPLTPYASDTISITPVLRLGNGIIS